MTHSQLLREACYIDGRWLPADDGDTIAVTNPANNPTATSVTLSDPLGGLPATYVTGSLRINGTASGMRSQPRYWRCRPGRVPRLKMR